MVSYKELLFRQKFHMLVNCTRQKPGDFVDFSGKLIQENGFILEIEETRLKTCENSQAYRIADSKSLLRPRHSKKFFETFKSCDDSTIFNFSFIKIHYYNIDNLNIWTIKT
ncbi:hypothetical protein RF11_03026 [Thelohanellus kitauei]|uniref:Uncharacterized protein n=1 Tax=Thelohanellus kitauei TaxID=669202 RepID=A0A0C2IRW0_THEKT|nr:hypothetical protein RF11_03026 [Thelohanellus kitauei]